MRFDQFILEFCCGLPDMLNDKSRAQKVGVQIDWKHIDWGNISLLQSLKYKWNHNINFFFSINMQ